jgi:hypothetical protein
MSSNQVPLTNNQQAQEIEPIKLNKVKQPRKRAKKSEPTAEQSLSNAGSDSAISQPIQVPVAVKAKKAPTEWNVFVKQHMKPGVSMSEVSKLYKERNQQQASA